MIIIAFNAQVQHAKNVLALISSTMDNVSLLALLPTIDYQISAKLVPQDAMCARQPHPVNNVLPTTSNMNPGA